MQPSAAQPTSHPDAVDIPGRPDYVDSYVQLVQGNHRPIPATAVYAVTTEHERRATQRDDDITVVYMPEAPPEMKYFARRFVHAYITPSDAPCKAHQAPSIRAAIAAVLPALRYELLPPGHGADRMVLFRTPEDREAAMARQPFALDDGGATVKLVREGETSDLQSFRRFRQETLVHVALHRYPREQRSVEEIRGNSSSFGHLIEVDPACFDAPDLSPVRAVVRTVHAREIPREVRIRWGGWWRHVVPVQILRVWEWSESLDANGEYVPIYGPAAVVPP